MRSHLIRIDDALKFIQEMEKSSIALEKRTLMRKIDRDASFVYGGGLKNSIAVDPLGNCVEVNADSLGQLNYRVGKKSKHNQLSIDFNNYFLPPWSS